MVRVSHLWEAVVHPFCVQARVGRGPPPLTRGVAGEVGRVCEQRGEALLLAGSHRAALQVGASAREHQLCATSPEFVARLEDS